MRYETGLILTPYRRSALHKATKGAEYPSDLAGVFEPVAISLPVGLVAHHLGNSRHAEHYTHPLHTAADRTGNFAHAQLSVLGQQLDDRESKRIAEQSTQPRLPITPFLHTGYLARFPNSGNENHLWLSVPIKNHLLAFEKSQTSGRSLVATSR